MASDFKVEGKCDKLFEGVRKAFAENLEKRGELGAACSIVLDGKPVVDIWGGHTDKLKTKPWQRDTLVNVYSTTKGLTATCAHRLIDQGKLDPDEPVSKYWPEFAQAKKKDLPVRYLLSHRAGLPGVSKPLPDEAIYNWATMASALAAQEPVWEPGTRPRLPCDPDRMAGGRGYSANYRQRPRNLFPHRDRRAARTRYAHRTRC